MWPNSGNRYYVENSRSFVDAPGEWHITDGGALPVSLPPEKDPPSSIFGGSFT